jgi:thiamine-monophosphate kinase
VSPALRDLGERRLITELLAQRYGDQPSFGDDCAVVPGLPTDQFDVVATSDVGPMPVLLRGSRHDLYDWGWLLATANLSDLAAAGATPLGILTSYVLPASTLVADFERLVSGVDDCCRAHDTRVFGGNLSDGDQVNLTATALGLCNKGERLSRSGAEPGDLLVVLGSPGLLWAAVLAQSDAVSVTAEDSALLTARALRPVAQIRVANVLARAHLVKAAIDVSDGLYAAVAELCTASNVGATVTAEVDLDSAVARICRDAGADPFDLFSLWGDWPLLVAVAPDSALAVVSASRASDVNAQVIGTVTEDRAVLLARGESACPWQGHAQERFSDESWSRGLVDVYIARLLGKATT